MVNYRCTDLIRYYCSSSSFSSSSPSSSSPSSSTLIFSLSSASFSLSTYSSMSSSSHSQPSSSLVLHCSPNKTLLSRPFDSAVLIANGSPDVDVLRFDYVCVVDWCFVILCEKCVQRLNTECSVLTTRCVVGWCFEIWCDKCVQQLNTVCSVLTTRLCEIDNRV